MNAKEHFTGYMLISLLCLSTLFYFMGWINYFWRLFPAYLLLNPDYDQLLGMKAHRSIFFHSLAYPIAMAYAICVIVEIPFNAALIKLLIIPLIIHLSLDLTWEPKGWIGTYCVSLFPIDNRLSGWISTIFYLGNIVGGIIILWII